MAVSKPHGREVAVVKHALISPLRDKMSANMADGPDIEIRGNILNHEYTMERRGKRICRGVQEVDRHPRHLHRGGRCRRGRRADPRPDRRRRADVPGVTGVAPDVRRSVLGDWLDAADPGALRRYHAARAALASLTAWLTVHLVVGWLADRPMPAVGLYAVTICFIGALVIVDARRAERQVTQLLSIAMVAVALLLASLLSGSGLALLGRPAGADLRILRGAAARPAPGRARPGADHEPVLRRRLGRHVGQPGLVPVCGRDRRAQPLVVAVRASALRSEAVVTEQRSGILPPRGFACRRRERRA